MIHGKLRIVENLGIFSLLTAPKRARFGCFCYSGNVEFIRPVPPDAVYQYTPFEQGKYSGFFSEEKLCSFFFCLSHTNLAGQANGMLFSSNELFKDAAHFKQRIVRKIYLAIEESGCWNGCMC